MGVSKPDKRVYKAAVGELMVQLMNDGRSVEEFFLGNEFSEGGGGDVATATYASYLMSNDDGRDSRTTKLEGCRSRCCRCIL